MEAARFLSAVRLECDAISIPSITKSRCGERSVSMRACVCVRSSFDGFCPFALHKGAIIVTPCRNNLMEASGGKGLGQEPSTARAKETGLESRSTAPGWIGWKKHLLPWQLGASLTLEEAGIH